MWSSTFSITFSNTWRRELISDSNHFFNAELHFPHNAFFFRSLLSIAFWNHVFQSLVSSPFLNHLLRSFFLDHFFRSLLQCGQSLLLNLFEPHTINIATALHLFSACTLDVHIDSDDSYARPLIQVCAQLIVWFERGRKVAREDNRAETNRITFFDHFFRALVLNQFLPSLFSVTFLDHFSDHFFDHVAQQHLNRDSNLFFNVVPPCLSLPSLPP